MHLPEDHSTSYQWEKDIKSGDNASLETDSTHRASFWTGLDGYVKASSASLSPAGSPPGFPSEVRGITLWWESSSRRSRRIQTEVSLRVDRALVQKP